MEEDEEAIAMAEEGERMQDCKAQQETKKSQMYSTLQGRFSIIDDALIDVDAAPSPSNLMPRHRYVMVT